MATDAKFKVGDRVRICRGCAQTAGIPSREEGKLATVLEDSEIRTDEGTWWAFGGCEETLELADEPALSPGRALTADGSARVNEEQREALSMARCKRCSAEACYDCVIGPDGNCGHCTADLMNEARSARAWDADKYAGVANWIPLDQRIAAAKAELSKPAPPRFIAEGRQDRALSVTNGMIRGRE